MRWVSFVDQRDSLIGIEFFFKFQVSHFIKLVDRFTTDQQLGGSGIKLVYGNLVALIVLGNHADGVSFDPQINIFGDKKDRSDRRIFLQIFGDGQNAIVPLINLKLRR